jgi:hypothetical protein
VSATSNQPHGTVARYLSGDRCDECKEANTEYHRKRRAWRRAVQQETGVPEGVSHGYSTYRNWGCRCPTCFAANAETCKAYYLEHHEPHPRPKREQHYIPSAKAERVSRVLGAPNWKEWKATA